MHGANWNKRLNSSLKTPLRTTSWEGYTKSCISWIELAWSSSVQQNCRAARRSRSPQYQIASSMVALPGDGEFKCISDVLAPERFCRTTIHVRDVTLLRDIALLRRGSAISLSIL